MGLSLTLAHYQRVMLTALRTQVEAYTQIVNVYGAMGGGWVDEAAQLLPQPGLRVSR